MRHGLTFLALITVPALAALAACSGDDDANPIPAADGGLSDAAANDAAHANDAGAPDAGNADDATDATDASDAGAPDDANGDADGGLLHAGTLIASGNVALTGFTSDGYVIYWQGTTLFAAPAAGGASQVILSDPDAAAERLVSASFRKGSDAVLLVGNAPQSAGPLSIWTAAKGTHAIAPSIAAYGLTFDVSPDGTSVAYTVADANGVPTSIAVTKSDGSGTPTVLETLPATSTCNPTVRFGSAGTLVVSYCAAPTDAGDPQVFTDAFDSATYAKTMSVAASVTTDPTGAWAWTGTELVSTKTGAVALTEPTGTGSFDATGAHFFYSPATTGGLIAIATATPSTQAVLLASGCQAPTQVSPDGSVITCYLNDADGGTGITLDGLATGTPASPWPLWSGRTSAQYTADSRYVVISSSNGVFAVPATGGASTKIADAAYAVIATGSTFFDLESGTLRFYDASGATPPTTLAEGIGGGLAFADWLQKIGYVVGTGASSALYVANAP